MAGWGDALRNAPIKEDDKVGIYNEAQLKILRLNKELEIINDCKRDPFGVDEHGQSKFIKEIRSIGIVYTEINSKLSPDEIESVDKLKKVLNNFLDKHSVIFNIKKKDAIDSDVWKVISHVIEEYDTLVRHLKDKHGFGMPDKLNPRKAAARRT